MVWYFIGVYIYDKWLVELQMLLRELQKKQESLDSTF